MKMIYTLLAMVAIAASLSGCLDDPDGAKEKISSTVPGFAL